MGKEFVVDSLEDMCALMCDNNTERLEERKMADIELVIKIPEEAYNSLSTLDDKFLSGAEMILKYGTPLPKGHGRLIDVKDLKKDLIYMSDFSDAKGVWEEDIDDAPTIIEADKGDKE